MKKYGWFIVAGVLGAIWLYRKRAADLASAKEGVTIPAGTTIGQVGAKIENPQALTDFAQALRAYAAPQVLLAREIDGGRVNQYWTDGGFSVLDTNLGPQPGTRP